MKLRIIELPESQIKELPFPETARKIGGIMVLDEDSLENHFNMRKFIRLWNEQIAGEAKFRTPVIAIPEDEL